jgi:hypothetical protein
MNIEGDNSKVKSRRKLTKDHIQFLVIGTTSTIISIALLAIYYITAFYIFHPALYLIMIIVGLMWLATSITACVEYKRKEK